MVDAGLSLNRDPLPSETVLVTTRQLIWARQPIAGDVTAGAFPWSQVTTIRLYGQPGGQTVEVESTSGQRLSLTGLRGNGITFGRPDPVHQHAGTLATMIGELADVRVTCSASVHRASLRPPDLRPPDLRPPDLRITGFWATGDAAGGPDVVGRAPRRE
jgi:hypothetical protein